MVNCCVFKSNNKGGLIKLDPARGVIVAGLEVPAGSSIRVITITSSQVISCIVPFVIQNNHAGMKK
jgi:hypothetical protein